MKKGSISLSLPRRQKPDANAFDIRAKQTAQWIADLPRANLGETARLIYRALKQTNHTDYPISDRFHFVESLRVPVAELATGMKKHIIGVKFPLRGKNKNAALACREIFATMATTYKIIIDDLLKKHRFFADNKLLAKVIHRTFSMSSQELLTAYQAYETYPNNFWFTLHQLYRLAEEKKLHHTVVHSRGEEKDANNTVQSQYIRILLTHLAQPWQLKQGEIGKVYNKLEQWSHLCKLENIDAADAKGLFFVELDGKRPPRVLTSKRIEKINANYRVLETSALCYTLKEELNQGNHFGATTIPGIEIMRERLSPELLNQLLQCWRSKPKRSFSRNEKEEPLQVTLGLSATHKIISSGHRPGTNKLVSPLPQVKDKFINTAEFDTGATCEITLPQRDVWDRYYPSKALFEMSKEEKPRPKDLQNAHKAEARYHHIESWTMQNDSARGCCLRPDAKTQKNIQVGELISIQRDGHGHRKWEIGVIRWIKQDASQGHLLGVEMLTPDAAAIGIRSAHEDTAAYNRTLMLPDLPILQQPKTLITSSTPYRVGQQLELKILGKKIPITLTEQYQNTGFFAQFGYDTGEKRQLNPITNNQGLTESDDSDNI